MKARTTIAPAVALLAALFMVLPPKLAGPKVALKNFRFDPGTVTIRAGGAVTFENRSSVTHTATCRGCPWDAGDIQPGQLKTLTLPKGGSFAFICRYHESRAMLMRIVVTGGSPVAPSPPPSPPRS